MIKFGILGTANIANRVADAIEGAGHQVYAIASRDLERFGFVLFSKVETQCDVEQTSGLLAVPIETALSAMVLMINSWKMIKFKLYIFPYLAAWQIVGQNVSETKSTLFRFLTRVSSGG